eukprot:3845607-Pyramimonas_sp.AAC.1
MYDPASCTRYPLHILLFNIQTYRWPRRLLLDGSISSPACPYRGITAGGSSATYEAKSYMMPIMTQALDPHSEGLSACIHNDDLNLCSWGEGVEWVVDTLVALAPKITKGLTALSLSLSIPKLNMVASSAK